MSGLDGARYHARPVSTNLHVTRESLDARLPELRALGTDQGTLELIVVRPSEGGAGGARDGRVDDRGRAGLPRRPYVDAEGTARRGNQLTIASTRLLDLIAESSLAALGDNLLVDMALDRAGLPAGARLAIGDTVVVQISRSPTGCAKFSALSGSDALRFDELARWP